MVDVPHMLVKSSESKLFGLAADVKIHTFHFTSSCTVLDGGTNNNGESIFKFCFYSKEILECKMILFSSGDFADHVKIWPERCSMTGSSFDVNFGSISNKWDRDGTPYDFGSIMHYR